MADMHGARREAGRRRSARMATEPLRPATTTTITTNPPAKTPTLTLRIQRHGPESRVGYSWSKPSMGALVAAVLEGLTADDA